ncbi:MAG: endonuclease domain-containing protein, partial [Xanthobacteraceae bacterium]
KTQIARRLRHDSTVVERRLWYRLRSGQIDGHRFRRQHPAGPYVLDFYCPELRLAIELDGGQHSFAAALGRDQRRDAWLAARGVVVLRFWNSDVIENMTGVLEKIAIVASELSPRNVTRTPRWSADLRVSERLKPLNGK